MEKLYEMFNANPFGFVIGAAFTIGLAFSIIKSFIKDD